MVTAHGYSPHRICRDAVTGRVTAKTALLRRVFPSQGFPIGTHGPGTQAGTQGKPCFAGAENLTKPDIAVWFNQAFIEQYARVETAEGTRTDTSSKPVSATG